MSEIRIHEFKAEQIPRSAFLHCPLKRFGLVRVATICLACPHHGGFVEVEPRAASFESRYRPLCGYPTARAIVTVEE